MAPLRIGIVGLDSSHSEQFTLRLHDAAHPGHVPGARVVAAWPGGSDDLPLSADRVAGFTAVLRDRLGVPILSSIAAVCAAADAVMILSVDGRAHLDQVREVVAAGRPVFIDKPVAADLATAVAIYRAAAEAGVPLWSSSATRFWSGVVGLARNPAAPRAAFASGPDPSLAHHAELFFYGIHAAESLFTVMGPGCRSVERVTSADLSLVSGRWDDDRLGVLAALHGLPVDSRDYAVTRIDGGRTASFPGVGDYHGLVAAIVAFFQTGRSPVSPRETLEIYAFLEAAGASRRRGGTPVALRDVLAAAGCPAAWMEPAP
jgi:predicted dehydrogenase